MTRHAPGCVLDPVYWLRHAVAAAGHLLSQQTPEGSKRDYDRISAVALTDALAHLAELPDWRTITLIEVAEHATTMDNVRFAHQCTCGAVSGAPSDD